MSYTSYDHDRLEAAEKLKIERTIYFQSEKSDIAELTALPLAELIRQKEESAAAEENIYSSLRSRRQLGRNRRARPYPLKKPLNTRGRPPYSIPLTNGRSATTTAAKSVTRYIE